MEEISSKDARDNLSDILNFVAFQGKHYTLTRNGKGMAVLISLDEWNSVERLLQKLEDEEDTGDAEAVIKGIESGKIKTISHKEMKHRLGL